MNYSCDQRASKRHEGLGFCDIPNIRGEFLKSSIIPLPSAGTGSAPGCLTGYVT